MNARIYGMPEPALADAYAYTARAVNRELRREAYVGPRIKELVRELTGPARHPAMRVEPGPWSPRTALGCVDVRTDMAFWVEETQDVHKTLWTLLGCDRGTHEELCEQYALAKAAHEAKEVE